MTTLLRKAVARAVELPRGPVVVTLYPDGLITFREKRRRKEYPLPLASLFVRAVDAESFLQHPPPSS